MKHDLYITRLTDETGKYVVRGEQVFVGTVGDITLNQTENGSYRCATLKGYTTGKETDEEGDDCLLAYLHIYQPTVDFVLYPSIIIYGYLDELRVSNKVREQNGSYRYTPASDPTWKPGLVDVRVYPKD